ncbi:MAG TPA: XrtA/PEP-CTERM system exopolysaccharide export protein [Alphaproteobacteria bacterium]|nr:XrtA/PEP-CTERM system exopolysaccharide export protein [Alphaproteobacteria bacterium]
MSDIRKRFLGIGPVIVGLATLLLTACAGHGGLPSAQFVSPKEGPGPDYIIGPMDQLQIFVWRNPEVSTTVTVRPDGRISVPLINDMAATGKTSTQLAHDLEKALKKYIQDPLVTVMVNQFTGPFAQQVRVVGEAQQPQAIPYRANMTLLDVMIQVGGLTEYAAGNRATLVRMVNGKQKQYHVHISDLIKDGDVRANVEVLPGDVIIIPESFF